MNISKDKLKPQFPYTDLEQFLVFLHYGEGTICKESP